MKFLKYFEDINPDTMPEQPFDLEKELPIVGEVNRNEITVAKPDDLPKDAQYAALNPSGEFIQKFYRFKDININDGTINKSFQYWGEQGGWHGSEFNRNGVDYKKLNTQKFLKIVDATNEVTISVGNVLTKSLLNKVDKAAYQFGGFKTKGGIVKKTSSTLDAKTIIVIDKKYIKGDITKFLNEFEKTMNSYYYKIELI